MGKVRLLLIVAAVVLSSCTPAPVEEEYQTKYPDTPTMVSAEGAMTGKLFKD